MDALRTLRVSDLCAVGFGISLLYALASFVFAKSVTTKLSGPKRTSWLLGYNADLIKGRSGDIFREWAKEFGRAFTMPSALGGQRIILTDPRAIAYVFNGNSYNFEKPGGSRAMIDKLVGGGILSAEGDDHKRMRKSMIPGFTVAAIREFTEYFLEATYKVRDDWYTSIANAKDGEAILNVAHWMNCISLDSIGLAGFSHNFNRVQGQESPVASAFDSMGKASGDPLSILVLSLFQAFPAVLKVPSKRNKIIDKLDDSMGTVARKLLVDNKSAEVEEGGQRSIVTSLIKAENRTLTESEVMAQMKTLLLAGYETTSTSLAWCLHELSMRPDLQQQLRTELAQFPQPSYEQLANSMPVLDAVVKETLRTHPVVPQAERMAATRDSIPLSKAVTTASGKVVDHINVAAGTRVIIPIEGIQLSEDVWGPTARQFDPNRWLTHDIPERATEMQGYHHLLTFIDGPKHCIGKHFAVAEFKAVLSVLIRSFVFSPKDGNGENVGFMRGIVLRPRTEGDMGLMLRVRRADA